MGQKLDLLAKVIISENVNHYSARIATAKINKMPDSKLLIIME